MINQPLILNEDEERLREIWRRIIYVSNNGDSLFSFNLFLETLLEVKEKLLIRLNTYEENEMEPEK